MVDYDHNHEWPFEGEVEVIKPVAVVKITITSVFMISMIFHHFLHNFHHLIALITLLPFKGPFLS